MTVGNGNLWFRSGSCARAALAMSAISIGIDLYMVALKNADNSFGSTKGALVLCQSWIDG